MKYKIILISVFLLALLTVSSVSANDNVTDETLKETDLDNVGLDDDVISSSGDLSAKDFNVKVESKEITVDDENESVVTFHWPENVDITGCVRIKYGDGDYDYKNVFLENGGANTNKTITFGDLYIFDEVLII